ncbi:MAG: hypothetical protein U9R42_07995 [Bacteroidota bacterium]|nr:hypothetical protein [Bacteroidota bacterium]
MKRLLLILTIGLITANSFSQTNCNIEKEYQQIFKIEKKKYGEREYLMKTINEIDTNSCFSDLVNNNGQYIDYLRIHFSDNSNYEKLMAISDTIELQNEFIKTLGNDSSFNNVMNKLTEKITNKSQFVPDTISMDGLLNIAVKYFYILRISKEGYYAGKVCTGINGIKQTEKERKPQVEAFCFTTIFNNYRGEQFNMHNELVKGIKELYKINLGIEDEERLLRAQGAMYMFMRHSESLKELLIFEYEKKKKYLPFILEIK